MMEWSTQPAQRRIITIIGATPTETGLLGEYATSLTKGVKVSSTRIDITNGI